MRSDMDMRVVTTGKLHQVASLEEGSQNEAFQVTQTIAQNFQKEHQTVAGRGRLVS